ncbi:MAG: hypothetical protein PVH29_09345 [Candidatus Zixiibacteriota bacterium]|jgi:rubredoxin
MKILVKLLFSITLIIAAIGLACGGNGRAEVEDTSSAETASADAETAAADAETASTEEMENKLTDEEIAALLPPLEDRPACPVCGSKKNVVPIVYGKPSWELVEAARRGEVVIEGCVHPEDAPEWHCRSCGREWK